jgi:hypothetical protein
MSKLTFTKREVRRGSSQIVIDVERNGVPFGQLWTFKNTRTTWHPWHAKPLNGEHKAFYKGETGRDLVAAKAYMEAHA